MTPPQLAKLVAQELGFCDTAIDFAVGEGALLRAVQDISARTHVIGFDIDKKMIKKSSIFLSTPQLRLSNGLTARLSYATLRGRIGIVGNPPFLDSSFQGQSWISKAFGTLSGKLGTDRAEVQFLARALVTMRQVGGRVVFILPIGFADGDVYRRIRTILMREYQLVKCIEIAAGVFADTEARTVVLVIDADHQENFETEICEIKDDDLNPKVILKAVLEPGCRLDARYHKAMKNTPIGGPQLRDLLVTVDRGIYSRKQAENLKIQVLHTSDLGKAKNQCLTDIGKRSDNILSTVITARKGDILLPRTGSRVKWTPVMIDSGEAPITDHVFRIRAPKSVRDLVYRSFCHPAFMGWLEGTSKGVCATVLTKRELLQMPIFAIV